MNDAPVPGAAQPAAPAALQPVRNQPDSSPKGQSGFLAYLYFRVGLEIDSLTPPIFLTDPETARRGRLVSRFGALGTLFGFAYAAFYGLIGHVWGMEIILVCSSFYAISPCLMRRAKSTDLAANFLVLTLILGFTALCFVEGGIHGHAIAWLVSVPLCALLLLGQRAATIWAGAAFCAGALVAGINLKGVELIPTYSMKWEPIVSAAGYLGLILFMFMLGLIFERGRARSFAKMQDALAELGASNERLVGLNQEKNEFLGMAAHDLKNPLTVIVGSAEMTTLVNNPEQVRKLSSNIIAAATRMRNLINDLLDVNAIEQGKFTSKIEACDVGALVEQVIEQNRAGAVKKNITFRVGASPSLWGKADRSATVQILDNLVSNAVKYSPPNTIVHVHTAPEANGVMVSVRDEGPGISEEDQKKLFQKYTRLTARPTGGESSTGLGLAIVKKLAEAMGGTVQCQSKLGFGANFMLRLPVWNGPVTQNPSAPSAAPRVVASATQTQTSVYTEQSSQSATR